MIYAGVPSVVGPGLKEGHIPTFLHLLNQGNYPESFRMALVGQNPVNMLVTHGISNADTNKSSNNKMIAIIVITTRLV